MTLGADTATYWHTHIANWSTPERAAPLLPNGLGQRFEKLAYTAGVPDATLHRLRHTVGTFLVMQGEILQASNGCDTAMSAPPCANTFTRLPLDDEDTVDTLADLYGLDPRMPSAHA